MHGKRFFTTNDHFMSQGEIFTSIPISGIDTVKVAEKCVDGFYGFGVAITPSSCYELSLMESAERKKLLENIYGKGGIGLSVGRICIGSSDYSPELYSYDDVPFDVELKHFSTERDERYIIPMIKEIIAVNPDIYLFASPWSPPYWMKTGNSIGGGYMRREYVDCYADYIIRFIKSYAEHGIKISAITPQNESDTQQFGRYPTCIWHPEIEAAFIKALRKRLDANKMDTRIWMYDHSFNNSGRVEWSLENCDGLRNECNGVAFHYYDGAIEETVALKKKYPDLEFHFTEGGPRLYDNYGTDWCKWSLMMVKALKCGYRSFTGWNLMLDEMGGPNVGPFMRMCGGLVTRDSRNGELSYSGQYRAFAHIAPFIKPSSEIYSLYVGEKYNYNISSYPKKLAEVEGVMIADENEKKTVILVNPNDCGIQAQIEIDGRLWYVELYSNSVSTVVIE